MKSRHPDFRPPSEATEKRVEELLGQLSLSEKIRLIGGQTGGRATYAVERLGIPALRLADGPAGVHWWCEASTTYPALIAAAASFDPDLVRRMGEGLGRDCRARGVHILLAPGVNIYRSPLCGRNFEYTGEDPCLASRIAAAYIDGVQSQGVSATVKHFAGNFQEYDRHHVSTDADERTLREIYLPAFEAAITEAGAGALMTAYNLVNGQHASQQEHLILDILKGEWDFQGIAMSDWVSVYDTIAAANNGLDLEMPGAVHFLEDKVLQALETGTVHPESIDDKVRRLLRLAVCFGWLGREQQDPAIPMQDPETERISRDVLLGGAVLLKNDDEVLPLDKDKLQKVAVIGRHAHPPVIGGGGSSYNPPYHTRSILEGVGAYLENEGQVLHAPGFDPERAEKVCQSLCFIQEDGTHGLRGEFFASVEPEGEPQTGQTWERIHKRWGRRPPVEGIDGAPFSARFSGFLDVGESQLYNFYMNIHGRCRLRVAGETLVDCWHSADPAIHKTMQRKLSAGRHAVELEFSQTHFRSILSLGAEPATAANREREAARQAAREADAAILCVGFTQETEHEGGDRTFALPTGTDEFITEICAENANVVLVLTAGGNVDMAPWIDKVKALLHIWYPGQDAAAVADLLFGAVNPSGKLPATFEDKLEHRSSAHSYGIATAQAEPPEWRKDYYRRITLADGVMTGYRHHDRHAIPPRFPFGFGLSYTSFSLENLHLSSREMEPGATIDITLDVTNTGDREGAEVIQLYISPPDSETPRPVKELKGFQKLHLQPGETQTARLSIGPRDLRTYDQWGKRWITIPGEYQALLGASSEDLPLRAFFQVVSR